MRGARDRCKSACGAQRSIAGRCRSDPSGGERRFRQLNWTAHSWLFWRLPIHARPTAPCSVPQKCAAFCATRWTIPRTATSFIPPWYAAELYKSPFRPEGAAPRLPPGCVANWSGNSALNGAHGWDTWANCAATCLRARCRRKRADGSCNGARRRRPSMHFSASAVGMTQSLRIRRSARDRVRRAPDQYHSHRRHSHSITGVAERSSCSPCLSCPKVRYFLDRSIGRPQAQHNLFL